MKRIITIATVLLSTPVLAHHPLAGQAMTTFWHGLLSGIGHPLLGFDHLFFVALVGVAAIYTRQTYIAPAGYIVAMLAGCLLMTAGFALPAIEWMIALSLLVLGFIVMSGRALSLPQAMALFAVAGLFHGSAFGESIAGAEVSATIAVLFGYLIGLGVLQYGVSLLCGKLMQTIWQASESNAIQARLVGALVAGVGVFLTLENIEGAAFSALGLG